ncbi:Peptidoglycan/LPS O-acetylase OafA/YrhL, contains acyltransferase and SGNH-hydrolase domains [Mucilaginibacter pineti]|uniref:Peptidoglycan/LPS O-acetylase OafA/YrhL, contains acyltransferase and SGNH-hydrolase domains n=1 Tax=Mucilaginibacter pineti TaxID=1391627 RepID=A0A1G6WA39_9SPHI|nr:acyltransferase [Mucilaginibacter pineti]SDD62664.1 Peptidoglycan/LPS O-acetylase OafA/YrhL, contains acyltransferase and SGNH-hydrolase domains [Mucilaginibacter pineti]
MKPGSIRFILAFTVILFHITKLVFLGHFAVCCFFILSGYWITFMYQKKYVKFKNPLFVFYISRIWRLFPVFLLFNLLGGVFTYFYNPGIFQALSTFSALKITGYIFSNIFLLGFNHITPVFLIPAWSLDIEFQFYLIYPALLSWLCKLNYKAFIGVILLAVLINLVFAKGFISKTLLYYIAFFLIGILIYLKNLTFNKNIESGALILFVLILATNYLIPGLRKITVGNNATDYNMYLNETLPLLIIPAISNSVRIKSSKFDRLLGDISYVMYLCHWVLIIPYNFYIKGISFSQRVPYSLVYLVLTLLLSYIIYKYYDKPIDSYRRGWVDSNEKLYK